MPLPIVMFSHALPGIVAASLAALTLWGVVKLGMKAYGKLTHH